MRFEYDPDKSRSNAQKRGIDFDAAQQLWDDPWLLRAPARTNDEPRFIVIGRVAGKHWATVCVERAQAARITSVRRARGTEVERYEGK